MCGILGISGDLAGDTDFDLLLTGILHRGPDGHNVKAFREGRVKLGHSRLSIVDLDIRSSQPMTSSCGRYTIVFNGEVYNYKKLRAVLLSEGAEFRTESDTEVVLQWIISNGEGGIEELDGMFAFSIYDSLQHSFLLARDHIGEKPLYFSHTGGNFAFCSEIGPLTKLGWIDMRMNERALKNFLFFLYSPPPDTFYRGIFELAPGGFLKYDISRDLLKQGKYYRLTDQLENVPQKTSLEEDVELFSGTFEEAVLSRTIGDVPLGMYLSGGLDSNAILAKLRPMVRDGFTGFTASYASSTESEEYDEGDEAARCSKHFRIDHQLVPIDLDGDFLSSLESTIDIFGQPFGNATSLVAQELAARVSLTNKVCFVGDAGDELLGGYPRYRAIRILKGSKRIPSSLISLALFCVRNCPEDGRGATGVRRLRQFLEACRLPMPKAYLQWVGYTDFERLNSALGTKGGTPFYERLVAIFERFEADPARAASIVDFVSFVPCNLLQAADRTSMASSLELRAPFVAKDLVHAMLGISSRNKFAKGYNKRLLVDGLGAILPSFILRSKKKPFNPPMRDFISRHLELLDEYLLGDESQISLVLATDFVQSEVRDFRSGRRDNSTYLWALCTLECWLRRTGEGAKFRRRESNGT